MLEEFGTNVPERVKCCSCGKKVEKTKARQVAVYKSWGDKKLRDEWLCRDCLLTYFPPAPPSIDDVEI